MDRRHRCFLSWSLGVGMIAAWPLCVGNLLSAPDASPAPSPSATPWVQASPPPGMTATPKPVDLPHPPAPAKTPAVSAPPATPSPEEVLREMMHRRAVEKSATDRAEKDEARQAAAAARRQPTDKADRPEGKEAMRLDQLPPDEREAYERNLPLWRQMGEEERDALRRRADERAKQETDKAYQESGLTLDHDEREVFELRYRQERRKLERELQERANAERARRLAEISDRLKHEFAGRTAAPAAPATPSPAPKKTTPAPKPDATPPAAHPEATPLPGFMR